MRSNQGKFYALAGLSGKILNCSLEKSRSSIDSFSIDGDIQTPIYSGFWGAGGPGGINIAKGNLANLQNATVWDVKIYDTSTGGSPLIHSWKGYPAGNTDSAWVDDVSTLDGDLTGSGETRDIAGGGTTSGGGSKLLIDGGETTITALYFELDGLDDDYIKLPANLGSDITGDKRITFNAYRHINETHTMFFFNFWDTTSDYLRMSTTGNNVHIYMDGTAPGKGHTYLNADLITEGLMQMEIIKTASEIESFKINGIEQTVDGSTYSGVNYTTSYAAGLSNQSLDNVSIWDVKIYDSDVGGNLTHWWKGTGPDADKDSAWVDQVGSLDGSVFGQSLSTVQITY